MDEWDVFISHAREDKEAVALPLARELRRRGLRVWLDAHEISLGDKLREKIEEGLSLSRFGVVILSPRSAAKTWPRDEIRALMAREQRGVKRILPVRYELDDADVADAFPLLGDRTSVSTSEGIKMVADAIEKEVLDPENKSPSSTAPSVARQFIALLEQNARRDEIRGFLRRNRQIVLETAWSRAAPIIWEPRLGYETADYAFSRVLSTEGTMRWTVVFLGSPSPFDTNAGASTAELDAWAHRVRQTEDWVSGHLSEARRSLEDITTDFEAVVVMGRRPPPDSDAIRWLREYNRTQFDMRIRTYDWLIDAALGIEES